MIEYKWIINLYFSKFWKNAHGWDVGRYKNLLIPISANFVSKLFSIVPKNTH